MKHVFTLDLPQVEVVYARGPTLSSSASLTFKRIAASSVPAPSQSVTSPSGPVASRLAEGTAYRS